MSMRWTEEDFTAYQAKWVTTGTSTGPEERLDEPEPDPGPESVLQERIERYCEDHALFYFHDRSRKCNVPGMVDIVIAMPSGRTLWLELKSRKGRLRKEQERTILSLLRCGHEAHVVRSFKAFLRLVNQDKPCST